jgi:hypothetical protein
MWCPGEAAISVENQGWMAEWDKKQAPKGAS